MDLNIFGSSSSKIWLGLNILWPQLPGICYTGVKYGQERRKIELHSEVYCAKERMIRWMGDISLNDKTPCTKQTKLEIVNFLIITVTVE